jgi:hypothetical protein
MRGRDDLLIVVLERNIKYIRTACVLIVHIDCLYHINGYANNPEGIMRTAVILLISAAIHTAPAVANGLSDSTDGRWLETPRQEQNVLSAFYILTNPKTSTQHYTGYAHI